MFWEELITGIVMAIAFIAMVLLTISAAYTFYIWLCGDIVAHHRRFKELKESSKEPLFEKDEDNPKIIYFYPKGK